MTSIGGAKQLSQSLMRWVIEVKNTEATRRVSTMVKMFI